MTPGHWGSLVIRIPDLLQHHYVDFAAPRESKIISAQQIGNQIVIAIELPVDTFAQLDREAIPPDYHRRRLIVRFRGQTVDPRERYLTSFAWTEHSRTDVYHLVEERQS